MGDWALGRILPDIPRIYTALAEWMACMLCIIEMKPRFKGWAFRGIAAGALVIQTVFLVVTDEAEGFWWMACMVFAVALMYLFLYVSCNISLKDAGYSCVRAFVLAEFAASLEWQLACFGYYGLEYKNMIIYILLLVATYGAVYGFFWLIAKFYDSDNERIGITTRELVSVAIIGVAVFLMSNVGFVYSRTPFSGGYSSDVFNVRTLIDLGGLAILYAYHVQRLNLRAQHELESVELILHNQYEQYKQSRETLELINYKYHDLKHHIIALRAEENRDKQNEYLDRLEEEIKSYGAQQYTGNKVLDTLLTSKSMTCMKEKIDLTCVVDGALLDFMNTMDICSIFGNALDNAIECEKKITEKDKRMIHVTVYSQKTFLIIGFENYCEKEVQFENNLPVTTKKHTEFHGYGLKSLQHTVRKYGGEVDIKAEANWFRLKILIPMEIKKD